MDELAALPDEARSLALDRFQLLRPHLELGRPLRSVAADAGIPLRTAQRWVTGYRRLGLAALARKGRADAGKRCVVSRTLKQAIEELVLQKPPCLPSIVSAGATACGGPRREGYELWNGPQHHS